MKYLTIIFATLLLAACGSNKREESAVIPEPAISTTIEIHVDTDTKQITMPAQPSPSSQYSFQVIAGEAGTFGYEIYVDGKKAISQPNIPAVPGTLGFAKQEHAEKVAALAIEKMRKGLMPPTIQPEDLEKLGVVK